MASASIRRTSSSVSLGTMRMSSSISTASGTTLTLLPPRMIVGAIEVCVQAWNSRASASGYRSTASRKVSASSSGVVISSGNPIWSMKRAQVSWMRVSGRNDETRRTTSAAFTRALSTR